MLHAVIMAGGSGSRFWPQSRDSRPKQLLNLAGSRSMIQTTVDRLADLVPPERLLIATTARVAPAVAAQLPQLPAGGILVEPCQRDTAPCIGLAAMQIARTDPEANLVVLPSDHVIQPVAQFTRAIRLAVRLVEQQPGRIVTFGIKPGYPAESFGYIERGEPLASLDPDDPPAYRAARFREKPSAQTAREYLDAGNFYWNAGIFVWRAATILEALAKHQPAMYARLERITASIGSPSYAAVLAEEFASIQRVSIDFAVMEHASDVAVVEARFSWDDVGSWQALARLEGSDSNGNTVIGRHLGINTTGSIVHTTADHLVVTLGLRDCLVVHTPDATLVANKHDEEAVRQVVKLLREQGWDEYL
jgi:mannose-1-phosphate guanylyltransferase